MAPCAMDFEVELTQIHNWLDVFVTFRQDQRGTRSTPILFSAESPNSSPPVLDPVTDALAAAVYHVLQQLDQGHKVGFMFLFWIEALYYLRWRCIFYKFYPLLLDNKDFESTCIVGVGSHEFKWRKNEGDIEGDLKQLKTTFTEAPNCFCQGRRMVYLCNAFVCA